MRKKIAILLLALCATATVNAQTGPMKVSKYNQATKAEDICGIYYWGYKYLPQQPTSNSDVTNEASGSMGYKTTHAAAITLLDADANTVQIWGMFDKPLTATFSIVNNTPRLTIPAGQVIETTKDGDNIILKSGGFGGAGGTYINTYPSINLSAGSSYFSTSYWWDPVSATTGENTGIYYRYTASTLSNNYLQSAQQFSDDNYNAIMDITWDRKFSDRRGWTYPVNITQNGNVVTIENFLGNGKTVNLTLKSDGTFSIPSQVAYTTANGDFYTYAADFSGENPQIVSDVIEGTGTERELIFNDFIIRTASGSWTGAYGKATIRFTKDNKFHFPVALTMTDAGWASFSSEKALDFTGTGLTPYAVSEVDATNGATLSPVEVAVAPHTGLFVSGVADNYEIPTVAEGNSLPANALVATSNATVVGDGATIWALGRDANSGGVGLQKVKNGTTVAANKAYLIFDRTAAGAKSFLPFNFGGTTAIEGSLTPNPSPEGKGSLYNLQGQRVGEGYRGIVIKNGKKVVIR